MSNRATTRPEGPASDPSYWFPAKRMINYFNSLPNTSETADLELLLEEKIAIVTHDDYYDASMVNFENDLGIESTHFLLVEPLEGEELPRAGDLQLHFDKSSATLRSQIALFKRKTGRMPRANRNHRILWRADHIDLTFLAMNGLRVDSSKAGNTPFRLCVEGRILPIWEVPYSICDGTLTERMNPIYSKAKDAESLFRSGATPIVGLFHPPSIVRQQGLLRNFKTFCALIRKFGYEPMTISDFYEKYLRKAA